MVTLETDDILHAEASDLRSGYGDPALPNLSGLIPSSPFIPDRPPIPIEVIFNYEQLRDFRVARAHWIVQYHYDTIYSMVEDGLESLAARTRLEWERFVMDNL